MKRWLFIYTTLIILAGLLCFFAATIYSTRINNLRIAEDTVRETAKICAELFREDMDLKAFVSVGDDTRITVISSSGTVLADSWPLDLVAVETHLDRPEVQAAASGSPAAYTRYSSTLGIDLIYYALKVPIQGSSPAEGERDHVFIRTAIPVARTEAYLTQSLPLLVFTFTIIALLCFFLTRQVIKRVTKPLESVKQKLSLISEGKFEKSPLTGSFEEIDAIVSEIDDVSQILQESMAALRDEKNKAEYILNNIGDGIFAVSQSHDIALINNAALSIFDVIPDIIGKDINYLSYDKTLLDAIYDCINHEKSSLSELSLEGRTYILAVKRLEGTALTMVILSDITDSRESARRREEFFENASHELKTPLTAIKGFNELCAINNKDERLGKYIEGITRETDRMLLLIGDMLRLSELSSTQDINPVCISLETVVSEVQEVLSAAISEKEVAVSVVGGGVISSEPRHIFDLVKNLIENAVRYNMQGGSVRVELSSDSLKVYDTGIGIAYKAQTRLFERFYRVEKSRSIRSGGTGLGLSIVKHICALYGWGLSLKSRPGVGTEVTVRFGN